MDAEIQAMSTVSEALKDLEEEAQARVLRWAAERYSVNTDIVPNKIEAGHNGVDNDDSGSSGDSSIYETLADLYVKADPTTRADKLLVAGYWHQVIKDSNELTSSQLNKDLRDLGHVVSEINKVVDSLMSQKPQLVVQLKKTEKSQQARKKYKLTKAGIDYVKNMLVN